MKRRWGMWETDLIIYELSWIIFLEEREEFYDVGVGVIESVRSRVEHENVIRS